MTEKVLQHEAADARAGIEGRQDEHRLEHDGEVVPDASRPRPKAEPKMLAMPTASDGAPPVRANSVLSPMSVRELRHLLDRHREPPAGDGVHGRLGCGADHAGADIDREVDARIEQRGRNHRHDGDEATRAPCCRSRPGARRVSLAISLGVVPLETSA